MITNFHGKGAGIEAKETGKRKRGVSLGAGVKSDIGKVRERSCKGKMKKGGGKKRRGVKR